MADVFISYSEGDASPFVKKIGDALENSGISCWYMEKDSLSGRYAGVITKAIRKCRVFLLVLDERSNQSKDVLSEVSIAFKSDKAILPFHLDNCELSDDLFYHLSPFTMVSAHPSEEKNVQDLVTRIAYMLGKDAPQPQPMQPDPPPANIIKRGKCGDEVTYELDDKGVLTISGKGPMREFTWDAKNKRYNMPWWDERETISCARILNGVTFIGNCTFWSCVSLTKVDIPDSVFGIGYFAFDGCVSLANIDIPDSVDYIGHAAFTGCASLASVNIPDSVTFIEHWAFDGCTNLKSVIVPADLDIRGVFPPHTEVIRRPRK